MQKSQKDNVEQIAELRKENEEQKADIHRHLNELIPELIKAAIAEGKKKKKNLTLYTLFLTLNSSCPLPNFFKQLITSG